MIKPGYTRVTEPLSLIQSFDGIDKIILKKAADRGTKVHRYCELYMMDEFTPADEEVEPYLSSFAQWYNVIVDEPLDIERRFYDDQLKITGKIDLIAKLHGDKKPSVIDIKTSQTKSKTWPLQLAAYKYLATLENIDCDRFLVVQLNKNGKRPEIIEYTEFNKYWELYKCALMTWRYSK